MSDLVVTVRQISNYPAINASSGLENVLVQQGGAGAPYASIPTANLVATALNDQGAMGIGMPLPEPPPAPGQLFAAGSVVFPAPGGGPLYNLYFDSADQLRYLSSGIGAAVAFENGTFVWQVAPAGGAGQLLASQDLTELLVLNVAGAMDLPNGTLSVARDPVTPFEVATLNYVSNNTVHSFNNRIGRVTLTPADIYQALQPDSPLATQNYVQQAIFTAMTTGPIVATWNGRTGNVNLMLSDITCVFFQPGQQPIAPTPPPGSNDYSIATTQWVTAAVQGDAAQVNVRDFGAKGDGVTDDTSAVQAAFTATVAGGEVWFPKGTYVLAGAITLSPTAAISVRGAGPGISVLNCASNGIALTLASNGYAIIRDLSIVYTGTGVANTGLALSSPDQSAFVVLENLKIRGNQSRTTGWLTGISMTGIGTPMLDKIVFQGPDGNGAAGATGIFYGGNTGTSQYATGFRLTNSLIQGGQYGVRIGSYVQGVYATATDIIGNDYGVYWNVTGGGVNVWLAITNCHLNCGSRNIYTNGVIEIGISNTLSYRFANGITNWAAIELVAAWKVVVSGNTMNAVGADTETGIILTGGGTDSNIISGNAFEHINGPAITLSGSTARVTITGNNAQNVAGALINDTTGNTTNMAIGNTYLGQSDLNYRSNTLTITGNVMPAASGQYLGAGGANQSWGTMFINTVVVGPDGGPFSALSGNALGEVVIAGVPRPDSTTRNLGSSGFPWQSGYFGSLFVNNTTIRSGAGAATGTQPRGSLWLRTDGASGSTLYVSQGGGTWAAVTGV